MEPSWSVLLEATAKLITVVGLYAYLLHLGDLRAKAIAVVTLAHLMVLFCIAP
jgi:hypothetical protein